MVRPTPLGLRLSSFWYLYMCGWGIFFPYYSLYLGRELALPGSRVGLVMAAIPLVGLAAQPLWGRLADRTGWRRGVLTVIAAGTAVAGAGLLLPRGFAAALAGTAVFAVFSTSVLPMTTSVTLAAVGRLGIGRFGVIRMWGTLGFLTMVLVFPWLLERVDGPALDGLPWRGLAWMFPAAAAFFLLAALVAFGLPDAGALVLRSERGDTRRLLRHPPLVRLLVLAFAAHVFLQGSINFFPLYVRDRGGDAATVGHMWIFMLLLEIPLVAFSGHTLKRLGARGLLTAGLAAEGLRWSTCALTRDLTLVAAVQLLHGVGVAGVLVGAALYAEQAVPERLRSTAQALNASVSFGAGAIVSNVAFGWLVERYGPDVPYAAAGIGALVLASALHRTLPPPRPPGAMDVLNT